MDDTKTLSQIKDLTGLINGHIASIERQKEELGKIKEMFDGVLNNDPSFLEADNKVKEQTKERTKIKGQIIQQPHAHDLNFKIKEHRLEIKQLQDELSNFLAQYQRVTGSTEFEGEDGEMRQIQISARLVGKTNFNDQ